ncbi:Apolipoprotein L3, partial [Heterocephalus glaber]
RFIKDVIDCFRHTVSREDLQRLVTEDEAWEMVRAEAGLGRAEADALRESLKVLADDMAKTARERQQEDQQARKKLLALFPQLKMELMEVIGKLRDLAGRISKLHKDCTITNVVASSTGTASGIMFWVGLALAPFTLGTSLALTGAGTVLGVASGVTGIASTAIDHSKASSVQKEAQSLISATVKNLTRFTERVGHFAPRVVSSSENWKEFLKDMGKSIRAIKLAMGDRALISLITTSLSIGNEMMQGGAKLMRPCIGSLARAITRGTKIVGVGTGVVGFGLDIYNLVEDSKHLHKGAKSDLGEELQKQAKELETILEHLQQTYQVL